MTDKWFNFKLSQEMLDETVASELKSIMGSTNDADLINACKLVFDHIARRTASTRIVRETELED